MLQNLAQYTRVLTPKVTFFHCQVKDVALFKRRMQSHLKTAYKGGADAVLKMLADEDDFKVLPSQHVFDPDATGLFAIVCVETMYTPPGLTTTGADSTQIQSFCIFDMTSVFGPADKTSTPTARITDIHSVESTTQAERVHEAAEHTRLLQNLFAWLRAFKAARFKKMLPR